MTPVNNQLLIALEKAVKANITQDEVGVVLSGGLDSTLIAYLAAKHAHVTGYCVGSVDSEDIRYVKKIANETSIKLKLINLTKNNLEDKLPDIVKYAGINPVKVGASVPIYYIASEAKQNTLLSGQGADELYGGYHKYLLALAKEGYNGVQKNIQYDIKHMFEENLNREIKICAAHDKQIKYPYMEPGFIKYSLTLNPENKIKKTTDAKEYDCIDVIGGHKYIRKYILRQAASKVGVPSTIINRKKKAAQYGAGAHKLIKRLALENNYKTKARKQGKKHYLSMYLAEL